MQSAIADAGAAISIRRAGADNPWFALLDVTINNLVIDGNLIRLTDRMCYIAGGLPIEPINPETDLFVIAPGANESIWRIITVKAVDPGGVPVLWLIQARQ